MWIKIEYSLPNKPEVFMISQRLGINKTETIGHLVTLWLWLDQICEDGTIKGNRDMVDAMTIPDFANSLIEVGWLHVIEDELEFTNFDRHNGTSAKKRATNARKVQRFRAKKVTEPKPMLVTSELLDKNREDKKRNNIDYDSYVSVWNKNCIQTPKIRRLTSKRKTAIRLLIKEFNFDDYVKVCEEVSKIPYLQGKNDHGWLATFDYVIRPDKFVKILEGGWDNKNEKKGGFDEWNT